MTISPTLRFEIMAVLAETRHNPAHNGKIEDSERMSLIAKAFKQDGYRKYTEQELMIFEKEI